MSIAITPTVSAPTAILMVDGTLLRSGSASGSLDLSVGPNTFVILVTAQDGTPQTYSLTVTRHSNNANLRSLTLSSGVLSPPFSANTTDYTVTLPNGRTNLTVTPTVADANATVTVNGGSGGSGLGLALGANPLTVRVIAQDGMTTQTYTLIVTRAGQAAISIAQTYTLVQEPTAQRTALATLSNTLTLTITVGNTADRTVTTKVETQAVASLPWLSPCDERYEGLVGADDDGIMPFARVNYPRRRDEVRYVLPVVWVEQRAGHNEGDVPILR